MVLGVNEMKRDNSISPAKLASYFGITRQAIYKQLNKGLIPGCYYDRKLKHWFIPEDILERMGYELVDEPEDESGS